MKGSRPLRFAAAMFAFVAVVPDVRAEPAEKAIIWNPTRTTSPDTVLELKALQDRVKRVVEKSTPSTVGLLVGSDMRAGAGSGVIVNEEGLVLTAAHVIMDTVSGTPYKAVKVVLPDGTIVAGKSLGVNPKIDSGMVQITDKPPKDASWAGAKDGKWPAAPLGNTADLKKGQWVVSLGHPGGPKLNRRPPVRVGRVENLNSEESSLQTDCTLVGGDSGGPLFDLTGKVVGIHSRIGMLLKYNIHIPVEAFRTDWDKMVKGETIGGGGRADLGVRLDDASEEATVAAVNPDGPAAKAGLKVGDVIVSFNGEKVHTPDDLDQLLAACDPGDEIEVEVARLSKTITTKVKLGRKPSRRR
jgi:serine protease Do